MADKQPQETGAHENKPAEDIASRPLTFNLDGTRMMLALQEAGLDLKDLDLKYLLARGAHSFEIQELESRLETARLSDWEVIVSVTVRY